jgi:hypothetical protein
MRVWLQVVWDRRPRVVLRKQGMLVLVASESHLTMDTKYMIHAVNTDIVVIPGGITS